MPWRRAYLGDREELESISQADLAELPDGVDVVAYCRGHFCLTSEDAVRTLQVAGRAALRLVDGLPEWVAAGLAVERASA